MESKHHHIKSIIQSSIDVKNAILDDRSYVDKIDNCCNLITQALQDGKKILFCGNGGSAADAQHLAAEFSGRFYIDRKALPAEALHVNTSYLTAVANDYGYDHVYSRIVNGIANEGDVLVALSTSGNSTNIINALEKAKEKGMITIGFTGRSGGKMREICDVLLNVPSDDTPRIQEAHIMTGHIICQLVEEKYFKG
jgi:D-sedoheptulose 7-phosphate isomerase